MPFLLFLKSLDFRYWIIIALLVVIGGMGFTMKIQHMVNSSLKNDVTKKELVIEQYKNSLDGLKDQIAKQNQAIENLASQNKNFADTLAAANTTNARLNAQAAKMITMIKNTYVPPDCEGAFTYLNTFTSDFAKGWNSK